MPKFLARGDYSQIEARMLAWLAGAEWKLDGFRKADRKEGPGLYEIGAAGIYGVPPSAITKDDPRRQVGKVSELALGYQGGVNALQAMSRGYGVKIPMHDRLASGQPARDIEPETGTDLWIVDRWRAANPEVAGNGRDGAPLGLWRALEDAAIDCMANAPGGVYPAGTRLSFQRNAKALALRLPSGRRLAYWSPKLRIVRTAWGQDKRAVVYRAENSMTHRWEEFTAYGGLWTENATQAAARDVMRDALILMEADGLNPVLTVHDEAICAIEASTPEDAASMVENCMLRTSAWAAGLPIACECSANWRYVKA